MIGASRFGAVVIGRNEGDRLKRCLASLPAAARIVYVDSGQGSVDDESDTDLLAAAYLALGYVDGTNFRHVIQPGADHSEVYWAQRFPGAMQLLLGER